MFTRQSEEQYREACRPESWDAVREASERYLGGGQAGDPSAFSIEPLPWEVRRIVQNEVLTAGMPFAALPVESLYRPWSAARGNNYGAQRGLYLGDAAHHVQAIYDELGLAVPEAFSASPDHLSLLLELVSIFIENGNDDAAGTVAADHFGWLGAYDEALEASAGKAEAADRLDAGRKAAVIEGVAHLRALVALIDGLARDVASQALARRDGRGCACTRTDRREPIAVRGDVR